MRWVINDSVVVNKYVVVSSSQWKHEMSGLPNPGPWPQVHHMHISPKACYFCLFCILFMLMAPSETVEPPGGRHEGAAVKVWVPILGSVRHPVASAPAPGAVGTWCRIWLHGSSKMFIFTRFYKGLFDALGHHIFALFPTVSEHACNHLVLR